MFLLILVQIFLTNELAGQGGKAGEIDARISLLEEENERLTQEVASASSLLRIEEKAREMGFVEASKTSYLFVGDLPIAFGQKQ